MIFQVHLVHSPQLWIQPFLQGLLGSLAESLVEDGNFSFLLFLIKIFKKILY